MKYFLLAAIFAGSLPIIAKAGDGVGNTSTKQLRQDINEAIKIAAKGRETAMRAAMAELEGDPTVMESVAKLMIASGVSRIDLITTLALKKAPSLLSLFNKEMKSRGYQSYHDGGGFGDAINYFAQDGKGGIGRGDSGSIHFYCAKGIDPKTAWAKIEKLSSGLAETDMWEKFTEQRFAAMEKLGCTTVEGTDFDGEYSETLRTSYAK